MSTLSQNNDDGIIEKDANCEKHGAFKSKLLKFGSVETWTKCPKCQEEEHIERKRLESERERAKIEKRKADAIERNMSLSGVPKRFEGHCFETFKDLNPQASAHKKSCMKYAIDFNDALMMGRSIVMCGNTGTGKTHLSCSIANYIIKEHAKRAVFTTVIKAVRSVKQTYSTKESEQDAINAFKHPDLLIFDEVGVQFGSDAEKIIFFEIINERYQECKPTILISNLNVEGLSEYVGDRVIDRMCENGGMLLNFAWKSYRGKI